MWAALWSWCIKALILQFMVPPTLIYIIHIPTPLHKHCSVSWGYRIHWLLLCTVLHSFNKCPGYDTKQSDGEVSVMLELWEMWSTPSLPLLPGPLWPEVVVSDRVLSMGQIELNCILMLNWIVWNRTVLTFNCINKIYTYTKLNWLN